MREKKPGTCPSGNTLRAYVSGTLSDRDRFMVEDHLLDCPLCADAVEGLTEYDDDLKAINPHRPSGLRRLPTRRMVGIAAALLVAIVAWSAYGYWRDGRYQRLYREYYSSEPLYGFDRQRAVAPGVRVTPEDEILHQAEAFQEERRYEEALMTWRSYFRAEPLPNDWRPYLQAAIAALETGRPDDAVYYLDQLPPHLEGAVGEQLKWYRAMIALRRNQPELARALLSEIVQPYYTLYGKEGAPAVLRKLE